MNDERWMLDCEFSRDKTFQHIEFKREREREIKYKKSH